MLPGECVGFDGVTCDCGEELKLQVLNTPAGYYLGYQCPNCGPYSRETGYMTEDYATRVMRIIERSYHS